MSTLVVTTPQGTTRHPAGEPVTLGREPGCTVHLPSSVVSRQHAVVEWSEGQWTYRDDSSSLGSWLDGVRVRTFPVGAGATVVLGQGEKAVRVTLGTEAVAPPRPGGPLAEPLQDGATVLTGDELALECAGRTYRLLPGRESILGRGDDADIICLNPTVSRHHALLRHTGAAWELVDTSARGTYVGGAKVQSVTLRGTTEVMLGDPRAGERLVASTSGETPVPLPRKVVDALRTNRPVAAGIAALLVVIVAAGGWGLAKAVTGPGGPDLERLARASVRVLTDSGSGSGTVVDAARGLILTNAHVAAPDAIGRGVRTARLADELGSAPTRITIATSNGLDEPAEERFRAEVAAVDGYLDLAVLRITGDEDGKAVSKQELESLEALVVSDADAVRSADPVWVVGYPGLADSDAATYTRGVVSGTVHDKRLKSAVSLFNSDARINPGNSGGLAANADGELIAVPTLNKKTRDDSLLAGLVPAELARPLIAAAQKKASYTSPWVTADAPGQVADISMGPGGTAEGLAEGCLRGGRARGRVVGIQVSLTGLADAAHHDLIVTIARETTSGLVLLGAASTADQWPLRLASTACVTATIDLGSELSPGTYVVRIGLGGNHKPIGKLTYRLS